MIIYIGIRFVMRTDILFLLAVLSVTANAFRSPIRIQISSRIRNSTLRMSDDLDIFDDDKFQTSSSVAQQKKAAKAASNKPAPAVSGVDGYMESDFKKMNKEQKNKVLVYIGLALVPCLALIPFAMQRDFSPLTQF